MKLEEHCAESLQLFGQRWKEVHLWLDEFAGKPGYGMRHRRVRHHLKGLAGVEQLFGPESVPVARQHIISDLKQEGWKEGDHFPIDEADYVEMGLF